MKKKFVLAACLIAFASACQSASQSAQSGDSNYHDRRAQKSQKQGGCCETEKSQAPKESPAAVTTAVPPQTKVEVKSEAAKIEKAQ